MNLHDLDIFMKLGIFMLVLSIICRIATKVLYQILIHEAERMESTRNRALLQCRERFFSDMGTRFGTGKIALRVEKILKEIQIGIVPLCLIRMSGLYCMLPAMLFWGIGAFRRIAAGGMLFEAFPFYIAAFTAIYVYLPVLALTDVSEKQMQLRCLLVDYFEECMSDVSEQPFYRQMGVIENNKRNITKKTRNKEVEKLLEEFLS